MGRHRQQQRHGFMKARRTWIGRPQAVVELQAFVIVSFVPFVPYDRSAQVDRKQQKLTETNLSAAAVCACVFQEVENASVSVNHRSTRKPSLLKLSSVVHFSRSRSVLGHGL
eukprot:g41368.t1